MSNENNYSNVSGKNHFMESLYFRKAKAVNCSQRMLKSGPALTNEKLMSAVLWE